MISNFVPDIKKARATLTRSLCDIATQHETVPLSLHAACDEAKDAALAAAGEAQALANRLKAAAADLEASAKKAAEDAEAVRFAKRSGITPDFTLKAAAKAITSAETTAAVLRSQILSVRESVSSSSGASHVSSPDSPDFMNLQRELEEAKREIEELRRKQSLLVKSLYIEREKTLLERMKHWLKLKRLKRCWRCSRWRPMSHFYHTDSLGIRFKYRECTECQIHSRPMMEAPPVLNRRAESPT